MKAPSTSKTDDGSLSRLPVCDSGNCYLTLTFLLAVLAILAYTSVAGADGSTYRQVVETKAIAPHDTLVTNSPIFFHSGIVNVDVDGGGNHDCTLLEGEVVVASQPTMSHFCHLTYIIPNDGVFHSVVLAAQNGEGSFYNLTITYHINEAN